MGIVGSTFLNAKKKIDEATSNTSLSRIRYVTTEKPKWLVFKKKEVKPLPMYKPERGCPCGNTGPCKQTVTPNGVTIHYPQKKKRFSRWSRYKPPKIDHTRNINHTIGNVKIIRPKKFPTWRLDKIIYNHETMSSPPDETKSKYKQPTMKTTANSEKADEDTSVGWGSSSVK